MKRKMPEQIFVRVDVEKEETYLSAWHTMFEAATDDRELVGVYELKEIKQVRKIVEVKRCP